jgi:hypothetical protein
MSKEELKNKLRKLNWYQVADLYDQAGIAIPAGASATELKKRLVNAHTEVN